MKRDPSVHITKSVFSDILDELGITDFPANRFFQLARRKAINARVITVSNNKVTKQVNKILLADYATTAMVADLLYAKRIQLKHRGVRKIQEGNSKDWSLCKRLAEICNTFCQDFGFTNVREGILKYLDIGLGRMDNYRNLLQRLISMSEVISEQYEAEIELKNDPNPWLTKQAFEYYVQKIAKVTGIWDNKEDPTKLIYFKRLAEQTTEIQKWIDAQFYALAYCNGLPAPRDLIGEKALERYNKYLYKIKNREEDPEPDTNKSMWDQIDN